MKINVFCFFVSFCNSIFKLCWNLITFTKLLFLDKLRNSDLFFKFRFDFDTVCKNILFEYVLHSRKLIFEILKSSEIWFFLWTFIIITESFFRLCFNVALLRFLTMLWSLSIWFKLSNWECFLNSWDVCLHFG